MEDPFRARNKKGRASLLGLPSRNDELESRKVQQQNEELFEKENDKKLEQLGDTVLQIKNLSKEIDPSIDQSTKHMDLLGNEMNSLEGAMGSAMKKLEDLKKQGGIKLLCILIVVLVFVFFIFYFIITKITTSKTDLPQE